MTSVRHQLFLNKSDGTSLAVDVSDEMTVAAVKESIQKNHGISFRLQRYIVDGKALKNEHTIAEYDLTRKFIHFVYPTTFCSTLFTFKRDLEPDDPITRARITERTAIAVAIAMQTTQFPRCLETILSDYLNDLGTMFNVNLRGLRYQDNLERALSIMPTDLPLSPPQKERAFLFKYFINHLHFTDQVTATPLAPRATLTNILAKIADFALLEALANGLREILQNVKYASLLSNSIYMELVDTVNVVIYDDFKAGLETESGKVSDLRNINMIQAILQVVAFHASQLKGEPSTNLMQSLATEIQTFVDNFQNGVLAAEKNYRHSLAMLTSTQSSGDPITEVVSFLNNECKKMDVKSTTEFKDGKMYITLKGAQENELKARADYLVATFNQEFKMPSENNSSAKHHYSVFSPIPKEAPPIYSRVKVETQGNEAIPVYELVINVPACQALIKPATIPDGSVTTLTRR